MRKQPNIFFDDKIAVLSEWEREFSSLDALPDFGEKTKSITRFLRDCKFLIREMNKARDPNLCDSVDLDSRYHVLENTRRRLLNVVQTEKAPL